MEKLLPHFYSHNIVIKTFHFKTKIYGHHKECDGYLKTFNDLLDKYMETVQGLKGRININDMTLKILLVDDNKVLDYMDKFIAHINIEKTMTKEGCLINILDDIIQNALQFKYLLSFN